MTGLVKGALLAIGWLAAGLTAAFGEPYPSRSVRIVVPFAPGGPTDIVARRIADRLQRDLGKPFIVDNRPGGATMIGAETVMRAVPDGYTILCGTSTTFTLAPSLYQDRHFDPRATLVPIVIAVETPLVMVSSNVTGTTTFAAFLSYARANPGRLSFASVGPGTISHLVGEVLKDSTGIDIEHVPYKGSAPAVTALVSGEVAMMFDQLGSVLPFIRSGQVQPLAVAAPRQYSDLPGVPTTVEVGLPALTRTIWTAFAAPAGTPAETVDLLNREINRALSDPALATSFAESGSFVVGGSPEHFRETWYSDEAFWTDAVTRLGIRLQ
ncbi:MAG: tripartite tricarboxylate transporter substrate binding protein [Bradyrhizobiaceae bacterium]|nr:tripartite tricarboxylate transporter substrate binding protein [Bradyrhizobiaceae bacterium]